MTRHLLAELAWRAMQVFVSALLVGFGAGDYLTALRSITFWQDIAGAAAIAVVSQLLALASIRANRQNTSQGKPCERLCASGDPALASSHATAATAQDRSGSRGDNDAAASERTGPDT